ncbi:BatD family protein [Endozoicomonadaceae bacterium StTr2]
MTTNNFSRPHTVLYLLVLLLLPATTVFAAGQPLTATVSRTILNEGEVLQLTVRSEQGGDLEPDLSPLASGFKVLGVNTRQSYENINGKSRHTTDWLISLVPLTTGRIIIPPLQGGQYKTEPINIEVLDTNAQLQSQGKSLPPVFIKSEVSQDHPYVQEEVILTLKIFYSVQLDSNSQLTPLEDDNLVVKQLGDAQSYDTVVNGQRLGVYEVRYAIFPQTSGVLELPRQTFASAIVSRNDPFGGGFFSMQSGRPIQIRSPAITLNVQPIPDDWPGGPWLPARKLTLETQWSQNAEDAAAGDALTRTITITAEGLTGDQLPPLHISDIEHIRRYPDKATSNDQLTSDGLVGRRTETDALIPEQDGSITVPSVKVRWFNTISRQVEVARTEGRTLTVKAALVSNPATSKIPASTTEVADNAVAENLNQEVVATSIQNLKLWQGLALLFALLWLGTLFLLFRYKSLLTRSGNLDSSSKHAVNVGKTAVINHEINNKTEKECRRELKSAIKNANPVEIRQKIIQWCRIKFNQPALISLEECLHCPGGNQMKNAFHKLEEALYNQSGHGELSELERALDNWLSDIKSGNIGKEAANGYSDSLYPE